MKCFLRIVITMVLATLSSHYALAYHNISPYAWCGGNPVKFVDENGCEINASWLDRYDQVFNTNYSQSFISELSFITGLTLSYNKNGYITYRKDINGNPVIASNNGHLQGSEIARKQVIDLIDNKEVLTINGAKTTAAEHGTNKIGFNLNQVQSFIDGTKNLDNRTLGVGMVFLHESFHTVMGGSLQDSNNNFETGSVVDIMNKIRMDLNNLGENFGERLSYPAIPGEDGNNYIPFDIHSVKSLQLGITPKKIFNQKFIYFKNQ